MIEKAMKPIKVLLCGVLVIQLVGCGTIMYPERRGQKSGKLDIGVVLLDGIGLFFFLIPGIIAYAVDFSNGTIYLPAGSASLDSKTMKQVKFDPKNTTNADLEAIIAKETGKQVKLNQSNMQITRLKSKSDMMDHFAHALPEIQNARVVLLNQ